MDENCYARYGLSSCTTVCKKIPRVLFLPQVHCVLGNFLLKFFLVEAYGNKARQVCLLVVALGSRAAVKFHIGFSIFLAKGLMVDLEVV